MRRHMLDRNAAALCLFAAALVTAGCSQSPEDRLYEAFRCGKAATLLERGADAAHAAKKAEADFAQIAGIGSPAQYMMELGTRFQEEVPLYRMSAGQQLKVLQDIYESDDCQAWYTPELLDLGATGTEGTQEAASDAVETASGGTTESTAPSAGMSETTAALMKTAQLLATQHGGDPVAVAQFCEQNARSFATIDELQRCKALAGAIGEMPVPKTMDEAIRISASLPLDQRFDFCTSERVLSLSTRPDDYDRCFPPEAREENLRLNGERDDSDWRPTQVSPMAIKEQIVATSAQMSPAERKVYCYTEGVLKAFNNDPAMCLNGEIVLTDDDPGYRDDGH